MKCGRMIYLRSIPVNKKRKYRYWSSKGKKMSFFLLAESDQESINMLLLTSVQNSFERNTTVTLKRWNKLIWKLKNLTKRIRQDVQFKLPIQITLIAKPQFNSVLLTKVVIGGGGLLKHRICMFFCHWQIHMMWLKKLLNFSMILGIRNH